MKEIIKEYEHLIGKIIIAIAIVIATLIFANSIKYVADQIVYGLQTQNVTTISY